MLRHTIRRRLRRISQAHTFRADQKNPVSHMITTKTAVQVADLAAEQTYVEHDPGAEAAFQLGGLRTFLAVPMLKENELIGAFVVSRVEVRPFTDKQIELVTTFAAQAVIAIENARLLSELRESLQEQTATSEVLQVISSSPGDLEPVFATMLENAVRICDATFGFIYRWDGAALTLRRRTMRRPVTRNTVGVCRRGLIRCRRVCGRRSRLSCRFRPIRC